LHKVPDHTTLYRFVQQLDEETLLAALNEIVRRVPASKRAYQEPAATATVDATGLAPGAISTFHVQRTQDRDGKPMPWRRWLMWLVLLVDTQRQLLLAHETCSGPYNGCAMLRLLVDAAHTGTPLGLVLTDAEFDSERNHCHVREQLGAMSVIPAKRGKETWRVQAIGLRCERPSHAIRTEGAHW
jgi:hypothetical protein